MINLNYKLQCLLQIQGNNECADCKSQNPEWASATLGIFLCYNCANVHRTLGARTSLVKSIRMDEWSLAQVEQIEKIGNIISNRYWERKISKKFIRPYPTEFYDLNEFIIDKYVNARWADSSRRPPSQSIHANKSGPNTQHQVVISNLGNNSTNKSHGVFSSTTINQKDQTSKRKHHNSSHTSHHHPNSRKLNMSRTSATAKRQTTSSSSISVDISVESVEHSANGKIQRIPDNTDSSSKSMNQESVENSASFSVASQEQISVIEMEESSTNANQNSAYFENIELNNLQSKQNFQIYMTPKSVSGMKKKVYSYDPFSGVPGEKTQEGMLFYQIKDNVVYSSDDENSKKKPMKKVRFTVDKHCIFSDQSSSDSDQSDHSTIEKTPNIFEEIASDDSSNDSSDPIIM